LTYSAKMNAVVLSGTKWSEGYCGLPKNLEVLRLRSG
jgi:hypothetical protein